MTSAEDMTFTDADLAIESWFNSDCKTLDEFKAQSESESEETDEEVEEEESSAVVLPLAILKKQSRLETTLVEQVNMDDLKCAIKYVEDGHDMIYDSTSLDYGKLELQKYKNLKTHLETYKQKIDKNNDVRVEYIKPKHGYGRVHPRGGLGLMSMPRGIRNALIGNKYVDFDLANAQPEIIRNICRSNNIECPAIDKYCLNRSNTLQEIADKFSVSIKKAKKLMLRLCFFGTFEAWAREQGVNSGGLLFIHEFTDELRNIAKIIRQHNPVLYEFARKKQEREKKNNALGCMFAFYLQEIELRIIEDIYAKLKANTCLIDDSIVYENDGLKLLKSNVNKFGGNSAVLALMNDELINMGWSTLKFEDKEIETDINLAQYMPAVLEENERLNDLETSNSYEAVKYRFEKNCFKIMSPAVYGSTIDDELSIISESEFITTYRDIKYEGIDHKGRPERKKFINEWLDDPDKRKYDRIDTYPPYCGKECPPNHFNSWSPFRAESIKDFEYDDEAVQMFLDHLMILSGHETVMFDYLKLLIAHMFQRPGVKSGVMPIFVSPEGAGKGTMMTVLKNIIGENRALETANADNIVGQFNKLLIGKYLVSFNELSKSQFDGKGGIVREFITDDHVVINGKHSDHVKYRSFHRCFASANDNNPFQTKDGDRRARFYYCSTELIGNRRHFQKLRETLYTDNATASIYQYFMNIPNVDEFMLIDAPKSEKQKDVQEINTSPVSLWLEEFANQDNFNKTSWTNKELLDSFVVWRDKNTFKYETNAQRLGYEILMLNIPGIARGKRTACGVPKVFDFPLITQHFRNKKGY